MSTLYSTKVTAVGGRSGTIKSDDGLLNLQLALPPTLGGKGGATALGVCLASMWPVGLAVMVVWLVTAKVTKMSSAATLIGVASAPIFSLILSDGEHALLALLVGLLIFWKHEGNIRRLIAGTEPKIGQK